MLQVKASISQKYTTNIQARKHSIVSDEPLSLEGQDEGMTPTELLGASLASCTCITMKMYAERKGWDVTIDVVVEVDYSYKNPKATFNKYIAIIGAVSDADKERLLKIASSCPIHKLLVQTSEINTVLV